MNAPPLRSALTVFQKFEHCRFLLITQQPGYPSGRNFSKQQLVFDRLHAPMADTRTKLTNFNYSKPMIAFNKVTNRCDIPWGDACPWASLMTCLARLLLLHETLYARISLASSIVLILRIVRVIYAKFYWARFRLLGTLLQHVAQ